MTADEQKVAALKRDAALREVVSTDAGQEFIWRLLTITGVFSDTFDVDPLVHAFNAGKRSMGLALMREAQRVAPRAYLAMTRKRINAEMLELEAAQQPPAGNTSTD